MNNNDLLPIGTICKVKDDKKGLYAIVGYSVRTDNDYFDYSCVAYPIGMLSKENVYLLKKENISKIVFKGYENEKFKQYSKVLEDVNQIVQNKVNKGQKISNKDTFNEVVVDLFKKYDIEVE